MPPALSRRAAAIVALLISALLIVPPSSAREEVSYPEFTSNEQARAALDAAYATAEAVTTMPATLVGHRAFYESIFASEPADRVLGEYEAFVLQLLLIASYAASVPERTPLDTIDTVCIGEALLDCHVTAAGWINGEDGTTRIAWQTQFGVTPETGFWAALSFSNPMARNGASLAGTSAVTVMTLPT